MVNELVESVGPFGGVEGDLWDGGIHSTIRQIVIYTSSSVIEGIQVEYDDEGESKWSEMHGQNKCAEKHTVELDYPSEYLCSVNGHYDLKDHYVVVQSLSFVSNRRNYGPFGTEKGNYFKFPSTDGYKIIGFHVRCGSFIESIGAFIEPIPVASLKRSIGPFGSNTGGYRWDDGSYTNIRKLIVCSSDVIESIQIEYEEDGQPILSNIHGSKSGKNDTVELDYPYEFLVSVSGYVGVVGTQEMVNSLTLKSNRRTYGPFGTEKGSSFQFPPTRGNKIIGFHGRCGVSLYSIGGFYKSIPDKKHWSSVGPFGRDGGHLWDDSVHTTIRQIVVHYEEVIEAFQVEYDDMGQSVWSDLRGREKWGTKAKVELDYPYEFLVSITGTYKEHFSVVVISSLTFETNKRTVGPFGIATGEYFRLPSSNGNKIVGFHGSACYHLDSLEAYYEPASESSQWVTVGPSGGEGGNSWNDEVHTSVRQLIIYSSDVVESIQIEYDNKGESKWSVIHGRTNGTKNTVVLDYPNEFFISISGHYCKKESKDVIYSLTIRSNKKTYGPFGTEKGHAFTFLSESGNKIIGFYGKAGCHLNSIGAYYEPIFDLKSWTRGDSFGRHGGCSWDDGTYTTVRKLIVCASDPGIESIQIEYDDFGKSKLSNIHGRKNGTTHTVELDYPNEFLVSVSGYFGEFHGFIIIHSLTIESNKRTYGPFGNERGEYFKVPSNSGKKIIGFYGASCYLLHSIRAYFEATPDSTK